MMSEEVRANIKDSLAYSARAYGFLPRPIPWGEVQVGDTIRAEQSTGVVRVEIRGPMRMLVTDGVEVTARWIHDGWSLTLIDRPEPERPAGSLWYQTRMDVGFVRTAARSHSQPHYLGFTGDFLAFKIWATDAELIAELIPWAERPDAAGDR